MIGGRSLEMHTANHVLLVHGIIDFLEITGQSIRLEELFVEEFLKCTPIILEVIRLQDIQSLEGSFDDFHYAAKLK
jgi:hypothetical protein